MRFHVFINFVVCSEMSQEGMANITVFDENKLRGQNIFCFGYG
jgi:hypothetical protein